MRVERKERKEQTHGDQDSCGALVKKGRLLIATLGFVSGNPDGRRNDAGRIGVEVIVGNFGELDRSRIHFEF